MTINLSKLPLYLCLTSCSVYVLVLFVLHVLLLIAFSWLAPYRRVVFQLLISCFRCNTFLTYPVRINISKVQSLVIFSRSSFSFVTVLWLAWLITLGLRFLVIALLNLYSSKSHFIISFSWFADFWVSWWDNILLSFEWLFTLSFKCK